MIHQKIDLIRVGERIREARCERCLTQAQLAEMTGCSPSSIDRIEHGYLRIDMDLLFHLALLLCKDCTWFFTDESREAYEERLCREIMHKFTLLGTEGLRRLQKMQPEFHAESL